MGCRFRKWFVILTNPFPSICGRTTLRAEIVVDFPGKTAIKLKAIALS